MPHGPWVMLLGHLLFGAVPLFLKLGLSAGLDTSTAVALRFLVALGLIAGLAALAKAWWHRALSELSLKPVNRRGLFFRGLWGGLAVLSYFYAVSLCGAGLGTLLNYTHSLWSNLFAVVVLGHKPARRFWPLLALAALGLWLVLDPGDAALSPLGVGVGLFSGMAGGAAILTIKDLRRTDNALTINGALALGGLGMGCLMMLAQSGQGREVLSAPTQAWVWVALSGVFSFGGQYFFNHGFKSTSVALASLISLSTPVLACFFGWIFLNEPFTPHFALGTLCIVTSMAFFGLNERESVKKSRST